MSKNQKRTKNGQFVRKNRFTTQSGRSTVYPESGAYFEISRDGQDEVESSDKVKCLAKIFLPCNESFEYLRRDLVFRHRIFLMDERLGGRWGYRKESIPNFRFNSKAFFGKKWAALFAEAERYCDTEIEKLEKAIRDRKQALEDAEL